MSSNASYMDYNRQRWIVGACDKPDSWWLRSVWGNWRPCTADTAARVIAADLVDASDPMGMCVRLGDPSWLERVWGGVVSVWRRNLARVKDEHNVQKNT